MNRDVAEGCLDVPQAITAHQEFHNFITEACQSIKTGVLFDIHGHTHPEGLVELGYLVPNCDLKSGQFHPETSSIRALTSRCGYSFENLIRGDVSLGSLLEMEGYAVVPSSQHRSAEGGCFTGHTPTSIVFLIMNCLSVCLSNVFDPGLHTKLWSGCMQGKRC